MDIHNWLVSVIKTVVRGPPPHTHTHCCLSSAEEGDRSILGASWAAAYSVRIWGTSTECGHPRVDTWKAERRANMVVSVSDRCARHSYYTASALPLRGWVPRMDGFPPLSSSLYPQALNQHRSCYLFIFDIKCAGVRHFSGSLTLQWTQGSGLT